MRTARVLVGDVRDVLQRLPSESVQCVVTSPPYWGLRDYGVPPSVWGGRPDCAHEWGDEIRLHKGGPHGPGVLLDGGRGVIAVQAAVKDIRAGALCSTCGAWRGCLGLEPTFALYVEHMVEVFTDVHRVLRPDGTLWLNLGDCYATGAGAVGDCPGGGDQGARWAGSVSETRGDGRPEANGHGVATKRKAPRSGYEGKHGYIEPGIGPLTQPNRMPQPGLKPKDLVGIPWRVAFALQADGWWLRSDVIWAKPNPMPESVTDRPTKAHEYLFLLTKSERYFYDADAIREPATEARSGNSERVFRGDRDGVEQHLGAGVPWTNEGTGRNRRTVWTITTQPYSGAHFAVMPEDLAEPCILAGTSEKGACAKCGAPWERDTERVRTLDGEPAELPPMKDTDRAEPSTAQGVGHWRLGTRVTHRGWFSTCLCTTTETKPCVVLDPFTGSGTVGVVALRRGRAFIGSELNPAYAELARSRIEGDAPLLNRAEVGT